MEKDRQQRDDRIEEATAAVIVARAAITSARTSADAANAAARATFEATGASINHAAAAAIAEQQITIGAAVRRLIAEKLSTQQVAQLTELTPAEVRNAFRNNVSDNGSAAPNSALGGGAPAATVQARL